MTYTTTYNPGDHVWISVFGHQEKECPGCRGRGRVTAAETGLRQRCGRCFGHQVVTDNQASHHAKEVAIYSVHVEQEKGDAEPRVWYKLDKDTLPPYVSPGISGTKHEDSLFRTQALAEAAVARNIAADDATDQLNEKEDK